LIQYNLQVAFQQAHRNGCTNGTEDANPGGVGDGFVFAPLLLLCFPLCIVAAGLLRRVMDGTGGIAAHLANLAFLIAFCDDGFAGELAGLELGPLRLILRGRLLGTNLGVLVAGESGVAFLLLAIRRTDLNQLRLRSDGFGDMPINLCLVAGRVGTLCGIWANCKSFLLALRRCDNRVRIEPCR
jgi:hypothetical protein